MANCPFFKTKFITVLLRSLKIDFIIVSISDNQSSHIDIYLLSPEDGRPSLVRATQRLCEQVVQRQFRTADITPQSIDTLLQGKIIEAAS